MSRRVRVATALRDVVLPDNNRYQGGDETVLTDDQFAQVATAVTAAVLVDLGAVVDPVTSSAADAARDAAITDAASKYVPLTQKAAVNGVATLDSSSKLLTAQRPASTQTSDANQLLAWNFDPLLASATGLLLAGAGVVHLAKMVAPGAGTVSKIAVGLTAAGVSLSNCYAGLYDATGSRLAVTGEQSSSWGTFVSTAPARVMSLTSSAIVAAGDVLYVGVVATGLTLPTLLCAGLGANAGMANVALTAAQGWRFGTSGTGLTALPSSLTLGSAAASSVPFWCGLS